MWDYLRHLFTPHHSNNHKARVLHIDALSVYTLFFALYAVLTFFIRHYAPDILGYATDIYADQLLSLTNSKRAEAGLPALSMNATLSQAAAAKAQDMFSKNYWAHNSPDGKTPWDFIRSSGYSYTLAGENLAKNFTDSGGVVNAWMASPTHKDNLLKSGYSDVGFAIVNGVLNGEETTLVVQMFGSTQIAKAAPQKPQAAETPAPTQARITTSPSPVPVITEEPEVPETAKLPESATENEATPVAAVTEKPASFIPPGISPLFAGTFLGVSEHPLLDLDKLTGTVAYGFVGFLMAAFVLDAFIVARKRIVRVSGNNLTHLFFLTAVLFLIGFATRGSIL